MARPDDLAETRLQSLLDHATEEFGSTYLWNVKSDLPMRLQARLVYDRLARHGGAEGLRRAAEIGRELETLGEKP